MPAYTAKIERPAAKAGHIYISALGIADAFREAIQQANSRNGGRWHRISLYEGHVPTTQLSKHVTTLVETNPDLFERTTVR